MLAGPECLLANLGGAPVNLRNEEMLGEAVMKTVLDPAAC